MSHCTFRDFMAAQIGTDAWIVANALTVAMKRRGYDAHVTPKRFADYRSRWVDAHPGVQAALALPPSFIKRTWLIEAARAHVRSMAPESGNPVQDASFAMHRKLCGLAA